MGFTVGVVHSSEDVGVRYPLTTDWTVEGFEPIGVTGVLESKVRTITTATNSPLVYQPKPEVFRTLLSENYF